MIKTPKYFLVNCTGENNKLLVGRDLLTRRKMLDSIKVSKMRREATALTIRRLTNMKGDK